MIFSLPVRFVISWWHCHVFLHTKWSMSISVILDLKKKKLLHRVIEAKSTAGRACTEPLTQTNTLLELSFISRSCEDFTSELKTSVLQGEM